MHDTVKEFDAVTAKCRAIFVDKMSDYGASWRIFRLHGITDPVCMASQTRSISRFVISVNGKRPV